MSTPATDEQNARYRAGKCSDCGNKPYSPGRPRCTECHLERIPNYEPGLKRRGK